MEAGETMVEIMRTTSTVGTPANSSVAGGETHEGIKQYYVQKIEELQVSNAVDSRCDLPASHLLAKRGREESKLASSSSQTKRTERQR